ncbi:MAG: hypothetical protein ACRDGT_02815 [Candidatus Limnocylindria bacterium]
MSGGAAAPEETGGDTRRLVRTVVCAYAREELPAAWIQVYRRFERSFERARLRVRVRLLPLEELPESFEVLVVAAHLEQKAAAAAGGARVVVATRETALEAVNALLVELQEGRGLYAEPVDPGAKNTVRRRGNVTL